MSETPRAVRGSTRLPQLPAAEVNPLDGSSTPAPLPIWATANVVQMGDHLLTDADQVLTLVGHLLTALRIMRM